MADWRRRARTVIRSGLITVAVMGALSLVSGLGWGWIANLGTPGTVRSWMAPATAVGLLISGSAHVVGIGVGLGGVLTLTRAIGLLAAAVVALYCLVNRERLGVLSALGITMLAFVLLGPVVQPWYLTWGIIILAPVVTGRMLYVVLGLSIVTPFIGLTGGADLLNQLIHTDPASMVLAVMVLWAVAIVPLGNWTTSWRLDRSRLPALAGARPGGRARVLRPGARPRDPGHSRRCSSTTSSHWRCLRPTSRSTPTSSKPAAWCSPMDVSLCPAIRAITEWKPWAEARTRSSARRSRPTPLPRWDRST